MSFVNVFGGTTIYPADVAYRDLPLTANTTLEWPTELASSANILASIMDVTPTGGTHTIRLPAANLASVGETALFFNVGAVNFIIADNGGNTLVTVAPGLAWQVYLTDNVTANGIWRSTQYGAGTSSATAGSLVGAGIKAIGTTLNQSMPSSSLNTNYTVGVGDRAQVLNWNGGAGTFTLPSAATAGADWFFNVRNSGTGSVTISPSVGGQFINGGASLVMNPGDSAVIFCDSAGFFTVGLGKSAAFAFDFVSIDLTGQPSPYTLSGANLNRIAYRFTGTITGNMEVVAPATVQQYWFANETSLASAPYTITLKTAAGSGVNLSRNQRAIVYCDGTNVVDADTGGISIPLTIAQGGTGATTESGARINLGGTSTGIAVFTAVSASSARNSLGSGATGDAIFIAANTAAAQAALGTITVPNGGTGATTLTGVVKGNGTSAFTAGTVSLTSEVSGTLPVANGGTGVTTSTGTVAVVLSNSPTLVTPNLGTPSAVTLTNATGLPLTTGVTGTLPVVNGGTGQTTYTNGQLLIGNTTGNTLTKATLTAGSGVSITNGTGSITIAATGSGGTVTSVNASGGTTGMTFSGGPITGSGTLTLAGTLAVANGGTGVTTSTGTTSVVLSNSPVLVTPTLGAASATSIANGLGAVGTPSYTFTGDLNTGMWSPAADTVAVSTAGAERLRVSSAGDVGIGTSSPGSKLDVVGDINASNYQILGSGASQAGTVGFLNSNGPSVQFWGSSSAQSGAMIINTAGSERMRITSSGFVGVGTSTDNGVDKLTVAGIVGSYISGRAGFHLYNGGATAEWFIGQPSASSHNLTFSKLVAGTYTDYVAINSSGNVGIGTTAPGVSLDVVGGIRARGGAPGALGANNNGYAFNTPGDNDTGMFSSADGQLEFYSNNGEVMRITSAGNVGIGTSSPGTKLEVSSSSFNIVASRSTTSFAAFQRFAPAGQQAHDFYTINGVEAGRITVNEANFMVFSNGAGATERMRIDSSGNVGIGTSSPGAKLDVVSGAGTDTIIRSLAGNAAYMVLQGTSFFNFNAVQSYDSSSNLQWAVGGNGTANTLAFSTNGANERMRITSAGNVGIGTTSPGYRLDIAAGDTTAGLGYAMRLRSNATATAATIQFTTSTVSTQNGIIACSDTGAMTIQTDGASSVLAFRTNGSERLRILNTGGITSGDLADAVGYKGVPQNAQTSAYTLALSDMGKHISITTGGVVIPANGSVAFPVGSTIVVYNDSGTAQNISITTDTLRLAGTATTGTRSLAQRGLATCVKVASTEWVVSGNVT